MPLQQAESRRGFWTATGASALLSGDDVPPVHEFNAAGRSPFLFTCDQQWADRLARILGGIEAVLRGAVDLVPGI
jgi:hypothetical protein